MIGDDITAIVAFTAGIVTFFAPCTFVTLPTFITYMVGRATGDSTLEQKGKGFRFQVMIAALIYVLGFVIVFTLLGLLSTQLGQFLFGNKSLFTQISAVIIIIFGIFMLLGDKIPALRFMFTERKMELKKVGDGYLVPLILGITSALSWTPCVGPILGGILFLAGSRADSTLEGGFYLMLYSLGISIPFLIIALGLGYTEKWIKKMAKYTNTIYKVSAVLLIIIGITLITGWSDDIFGWIYTMFKDLGYMPK